MTRSLLATAMLVGAVLPAAAQTEGRFGVGGSVTVNSTVDSELGVGFGGGLLVRRNPRRGWGPAGAFNWFRADLTNPDGGAGDFARLRIRPLMAGVSYTVGAGRLLTSFSIVGGPSFNRADFHRDFAGAGASAIDADTSAAVRPGVGLTYSLTPRVALVGFGGYLLNRPGVRYRDGEGRDFRDRWKADAVVLSIGAVYSIF